MARARFLRRFYGAVPNIASMKGIAVVLVWLAYVAALWGVLIYRDHRNRR